MVLLPERGWAGGPGALFSEEGGIGQLMEGGTWAAGGGRHGQLMEGGTWAADGGRYLGS